MPAQRLRSRSFRRVYVKTPANRVTIHYRKRKPGKAKCAMCKSILNGVLNERPYKMKMAPKTCKRPSRPYGGVLCSNCARQAFKKKIRSLK